MYSQLRQDAEEVQEKEQRITPKPIPADGLKKAETEMDAETETNSEFEETETAPAVVDELESAEEDEQEEIVTEREAEEDAETAIEETEETIEETEPVTKITMISCRGDAWQQGEDSDRTIGWPAKLQAVLEERNIPLKVVDGTWDMSGSLSQLSYAGVPLAQVAEFIRSHQEAGLSDVRTEMRVRRDLKRKIVERTDYDAVPVITIGYNGGFGRNLEELVEQQRLILETYNIPQLPEGAVHSADNGEQGIAGCYLILGRYPSGWTDPAAYDEAMTKAWGTHYVSLNELEGDVSSDEFRQGVADTVFTQLSEHGYLTE